MSDSEPTLFTTVEQLTRKSWYGVDLTGLRFGKWTVLGRAPALPGNACVRWYVRCDCGTEDDKAGHYLYRGHSKCCAKCLVRKTTKGIHFTLGYRRKGHGGRFVDLTGQRFDKIVVLEQAYWKQESGRSASGWRCRCDCGKEVIRSATALKREQVSCGCSQRHPKLPHGEAATRRLLFTYERQAELRGIEWRLTREQVCDLISSPCHYCGAIPATVANNHDPTFLTNGIDRKNNEPWYDGGNTVPCCPKCNRNKGAMTAKQFAEWINQVHKHYAKLAA